MTSDRSKKSKKPSDVAERFKKLQQLRVKVWRAELAISRKKPPDSNVAVTGEGRSPQKPSGRSRLH